MIFYLILILTVVLIAYSYRAVHLVTAKMKKRLKWTFRIAYLFLTVFVYATTMYLAINRENYEDNPFLRSYSIVGAITNSVTVLIISIFQLIADLILLGRYIAFRATEAKRSPGTQMTRRTFVNKLALGMGGLMLGSFLWGTTKGKYGWRILKTILLLGTSPMHLMA